MSNRYEGVAIEHLYMMLDDVRRHIEGIKDHGNELERGHPMFCLVGQKIEIELAIANIKK